MVKKKKDTFVLMHSYIYYKGFYILTFLCQGYEVEYTTELFQSL